MRTYHVLYSRPGGFMNLPGRYFTAGMKIRPFTIIMFRKWFGTEPTFHWHVDGFMAEASDDRGNSVQIHQHNHGYVEKVRPRNWLKHYRFWVRLNGGEYRGMVVDWHAKLLTLPQLEWKEAA